MEDNSAISSPKHIIDYLTGIPRRHCILSARYAVNDQAVLTAMLQIDLKHNALAIDARKINNIMVCEPILINRK
ncbi:flagellar regulator YcgR PilZN domain-containing protein [Methylomonas defluvii]|uniref:flagellar regulator YcgR PilZN domain-containing protein n=1 Tax=Methylomonas defluvii TaxID=3045149 RepID=UPI003CC541E5